MILSMVRKTIFSFLLLSIIAYGGTAKLLWFVPGSKQIVRYDFRYSVFPIDTTNWNDAAQVIGEPTPGVAGTAQRMSVGNLNDNALYFFALEAVATDSSYIPITNMVAKTFPSDTTSFCSIMTIKQPKIPVAPDTISTDTLCIYLVDLGDSYYDSSSTIGVGSVFHKVKEGLFVLVDKTWVDTLSYKYMDALILLRCKEDRYDINRDNSLNGLDYLNTFKQIFLFKGEVNK